MSTESGFPGLPATGADERQVAIVVNRLNRGKMNVVGSVTLTASVSNTDVAWPNAGLSTVVMLVPSTAGAWADTIRPYASAVTSKVGFTLTHTVSASAGRTYNFIALG